MLMLMLTLCLCLLARHHDELSTARASNSSLSAESADVEEAGIFGNMDVDDVGYKHVGTLRITSAFSSCAPLPAFQSD